MCLEGRGKGGGVFFCTALQKDSHCYAFEHLTTVKRNIYFLSIEWRGFNGFGSVLMLVFMVVPPQYEGSFHPQFQNCLFIIENYISWKRMDKKDIYIQRWLL